MKTIILFIILSITACTVPPLDELEERSTCSFNMERAVFYRLGTSQPQFVNILKSFGIDVRHQYPYNTGVYTLSLKASGAGSIRVYSKCGAWIWEEWQILNLPFDGELRDLYCGDQVGIYVDWFSGPDGTGEKCGTTKNLNGLPQKGYNPQVPKHIRENRE